MIREFLDDDYKSRIEFSEIISDQIHAIPNLSLNICFIVDSSFFLNGSVNRHNCIEVT